LRVLSVWIRSYLADCYALAEGTRGLYAYHLDRFAKEVGDRPMDEVGVEVVRSFMASLRRQDDEPYSPSYVDQVYRTLNTFLAWVVREDGLTANPMEHVRRPRVPHRKSPRLHLDEVERLLQAVRRGANPARDLAMVCLAVDSGLRRSEIAGLELDALDTERGVVNVLGKGGKEREVPISEPTCHALEAWLGVRPANGCSKVFVTRRGGAFTTGGMQTLIYRLKERAGLPHLRWHLLRHTFANYFIANGGGLRQAQKILGHADIKTTAAIYTDPELNWLQDAHRRASPLNNIDGNGQGSGEEC
jgi:integrase/recombinase XerC